MNKLYLLVAVIFFSLVTTIFIFRKIKVNKENLVADKAQQYNPQIDPKDFVEGINNKYFTLTPGTKFTFEKKTDEDTEKIVVEVLKEKKEIMGIRAITVRDRAYMNDELIEDTYDWYAQDKDGNVWYLGEVVDNYGGGEVKDHKGSWEAGINGALPGIIMKAGPVVGDSYRQEYYKGEAEDMADVLESGVDVAVPYGSFKDCIKTKDYSLIEANLIEYKYYCPEVRFAVLEEEGDDSLELVSVSKP